MLHALPDAPRHVRSVEKNHSKPCRQCVATGRRDYPRSERRSSFEKGRGRATYPQCDPRGRWPADPQRLGRWAAFIRLHLPEVPPLPHSTPALRPRTHPQIPRTSPIFLGRSINVLRHDEFRLDEVRYISTNKWTHPQLLPS